MLLAVPKYGRVKVNKVLQVVPDLAVEDDRRPVAAPAHRAGLDAAPLASPRVGAVFVITGPSGVGKGTLIRTLLERVPELELSVSATTREPRPGEDDGVDYHFLDRGRVRPPRASRASSSSTPTTPAAATARCAPSSSGGSQTRRLGRAGDRGPGRAPGRARRCPRRCGSSSPRRSEEALRTRLVGRGTDDARAASRPAGHGPRASCAAQDEFDTRRRQRPPRASAVEESRQRVVPSPAR